MACSLALCAPSLPPQGPSLTDRAGLLCRKPVAPSARAVCSEPPRRAFRAFPSGPRDVDRALTLSPHPCKAVAAHPQTLSATPSIGLNLPSGSSLPDLCPYCLQCFISSLNTWVHGHHPLPPSPWLNLGSPLGLTAPQCQCLMWSLLLLVPNVHVHSPVCLLFHGKTRISTRAGLYPRLSSLNAT